MSTPLERITARVDPFLEDGTTSTMPLLTLEEFFDGNDVYGSIWCNVTLGGNPPELVSPAQAAAVLYQIRARDDVDDVRVAVTMFDDPDWPFSDRVVVVTDAEPDHVQAWFPTTVAPDAVYLMDETERYEPIGIAEQRFRICWWD